MYSRDMEQFHCEKNGGLRDTVIDFGDDGNGICHDQATVGDICYSIQRAIQLGTKQQLNKIIKRGMNADHLGAGLSRI
jgi:starch synthase